MKLAGKKVAMMRCAYDPMIGPKPKQAFVFSEMNAEAIFNDEATGVIITLQSGMKHFVFGANIQSIRLEAEEPKVKKT